MSIALYALDIPFSRFISGRMDEQYFINGGSSGYPPSSASSSISPPLQVQEEEEEVNQHHEQNQQEQNQRQTNVSFRVNFTIFDWSSSDIMDEAWSCLSVLVIFWFFAVSLTLILGFYASMDLRVGPNCSHILQANPLFVNEIKVQEVADDLKQGPVLYGFYSPPPLDVETTWTETYNISVPANSHKEWIYNLNHGSEIDIMYRVKSLDSSPLSLVIAQGKENLVEWIEDPSYPNVTLSWNIIHGSGRIQQKIFISSDYYVAVGNLNPEEIEVQLNLSIRAFLYNTTEAYYKCPLSHGVCSLKLFLLRGNVALLSSPGPEQGTPTEDWFVKVSYEPRWMAYFIGSGAMTVLFFIIYKVWVKFQCLNGNETRENGSERTPLLAHKDDDLLSLGSSYDSVSHDEEDLEDSFAAGSTETKQLKEGENENPRRLCTICFDAPRDCFFLPCGHCATCFTCGTRIVEDAGVCPICRRKMKKLRKIFAV
ncbi:zinc finger protein [Macleaya cordata]|uniref:Zinc finger protein n=1 Tax=Macleaya cordata TaxID=56857 RepID=A0A200PLK6_MACCD|nr:zinc finger protein [Macleaya cordata]